MEKRKKIKVKKLTLTAAQVKYARKIALESFASLMVWKDSKVTKQQGKKKKGILA